MTVRTRTLLLLRHAKSDYPAGVGDHERPLAERGIREAALAGDWIRSSIGTVDAVLCSTATRTRQTFQRTGITAPVQYEEEIYESSPGVVLGEINVAAGRFDTDPATLLVIGHEPVMSGLALGLADVESGEGAVAQEVSAKFPTSAIAVLRVDSPWNRLEMGSAELIDFHIPR